jgi:hypothetical protein
MAAERKGAIEIFKVAGIQVAIDYSWLIIFALILWSLSSGYFPAKYPGYSTRFAAESLFRIRSQVEKADVTRGNFRIEGEVELAQVPRFPPSP